LKEPHATNTIFFGAILLSGSKYPAIIITHNYEQQHNYTIDIIFPLPPLVGV
jgi:hypothetical protein